jgi:MerR family transcriptional activator of bmr gene
MGTVQKVKNYFSIGEAAEAARMTRETLRHYDRIGLVKPSHKDEWTQYRYYTQQDIVRLNTIRALQMMDLPLQEIKQVLAWDDLEKIVDFLSRAEQKADEKIAAMQYSKVKIQRARAEYEKKLSARQSGDEAFVQVFPARVILLSDTLEEPALDNLWDYLRHFTEQIPPETRERFAFEDAAGIYTEEGRSRLFAVCVRHAQIEGLKHLPGGRYLCAHCTEENREEVRSGLLHRARAEWGAEPGFSIQSIVISGILQWNYQIQIYLGSE